MPHRRRYARTPDTILLLSSLTASGAVVAVTHLAPPAVYALVTPAVSTAWACVLAISAATALLGVLWSDPVTGWALEIAGRVGLTAAMTAYAVALIDHAADARTPPPTVIDLVYLAIVVGIAASSAWRCRQLWHQWTEYRHALDRTGGDHE